MSRYLVVLQAGKESHEGLARAYHALLYCKDFMEKGIEVKLIFDGAGTEWIPELMKPDHKLHALFEEIRAKDVIAAVCDFCAGAFGVKDKLSNKGLPLDSEFQGHPSIAKYVKEGYQVLVL